MYVQESKMSYWGVTITVLDYDLSFHVLDTTLCDKGQWLATACPWGPKAVLFCLTKFLLEALSLGTLVSSTNKIDHHVITEILLKVALNTKNQINPSIRFHNINTYIFASFCCHLLHHMLELTSCIKTVR